MNILTKRQSKEEKLQQIINDKGAYATSIVQRWEDVAKADGRWDNNFATDLRSAAVLRASVFPD
jgi:hypothetical protein